MSIPVKLLLDRIDLTMAVHTANFNDNKSPMPSAMRGGWKEREHDIYGIVSPSGIRR
jgi:hypothetical protein